MHRFFVEPECIGDNGAIVDGPVARQVARVLRMRPGDPIVLLDNTGLEYVVRLDSVSPKMLEGEVVEKRRGTGDPSVLVTLYQGVLKSDKLETVLQKGTEIGIAAFAPVFCRRSVVRAPRTYSDRRFPRWRKIITEAAEQCERSLVPHLGPLMTWQQALTSAQGVRLMAWVGEPGRRSQWQRRGEDGLPGGRPGQHGQDSQRGAEPVRGAGGRLRPGGGGAGAGRRGHDGEPGPAHPSRRDGGPGNGLGRHVRGGRDGRLALQALGPLISLE